ncbi:Uncharacterised protein [Candidatus Tiddalikarchaeum anstoanum]|nr:Uncharacterised protein [Candidatus Tiddalikarchaeum anstoanum]
MIKRDYMIRCKRCNIPYKPENVSRIRTCIYCRKSEVSSRTDRLKILVNDIKNYYASHHIYPSTDIVKTWINLKFEVSDSTADSYFKELAKITVVREADEKYIEQVKIPAVSTNY